MKTFIERAGFAACFVTAGLAAWPGTTLAWYFGTPRATFADDDTGSNSGSKCGNKAIRMVTKDKGGFPDSHAQSLTITLESTLEATKPVGVHDDNDTSCVSLQQATLEVPVILENLEESVNVSFRAKGGTTKSNSTEAYRENRTIAAFGPYIAGEIQTDPEKCAYSNPGNLIYEGVRALNDWPSVEPRMQPSGTLWDLSKKDDASTGTTGQVFGVKPMCLSTAQKKDGIQMMDGYLGPFNVNQIRSIKLNWYLYNKVTAKPHSETNFLGQKNYLKTSSNADANVTLTVDLPSLLNSSVNLEPLPEDSKLGDGFSSDTTGCPQEQNKGKFVVRTKLTNNSGNKLYGIELQTKKLTNDNRLLVATSQVEVGGTDGINAVVKEGSTFAVKGKPILGPNEETTMQLSICLKDKVPFRLALDVHGFTR